MPVILVLTKFDAVVSKVLVDTAHGDVLQYERARARAYAICEDSIRRRFGKDPRDVPAEIVSGTYSLSLYVLQGGHLTSPVALSRAELRRSYREAGRDDGWVRPRPTPSIKGIWHSGRNVTSRRHISCVVCSNTSMPSYPPSNFN